MVRGASSSAVYAFPSVLAGICFVLCSLQLAQRPAVEAAVAQPEVRSTLRVSFWTLWHDRQVELTPGSGASLRSCETCAARPLVQSATILADGSSLGLIEKSKTVRFSRLWISGAITLAAHGETVTLHNPIAVSARAGALIFVVTIPVESYVGRVVASESGPNDSAESLKALAIVVRSYALHESHGHADYDVCDTTHCQHLRWANTHTAQSESATLATSGETLWFRGHRALAYFSKDCGGHTASSSEIWPHAAAASYLPSHPDPYCMRSSGSEWASEITRADLSSALSARGLARSGWQRLTVSRRAESGRAVAIRLDATEILAEDFRIAIGESLGWNKIPSTWFEVSRQGDKFFFHGRGWGHGVGLCQKGAAAMAAQNLTSREILAQYFPEAEAADESTGQAWKSSTGSGVALESLNADDASFLPQLERARAEAAQRSGLNAPVRFTVRAFASTRAFRDSTLSPGWLAAFTRGDWIATQPLRTLATRHLLVATLRHEFLHGLIERESGSATPLWFREGLAETWGEDTSANTAQNALPALNLDSLNDALIHANTESESEAAHRAAAWYTARLLNRYGREQAFTWLRSGIPSSVVAALGQR